MNEIKSSKQQEFAKTKEEIVSLLKGMTVKEGEELLFNVLNEVRSSALITGQVLESPDEKISFQVN